MQGFEQDAESQAGASMPDPQDESTTPLGVGGEFGGGDAGFDPLAGAESKSGLNTSAVLLVLVVVLGASGLFVMRTLTNMISVASADEQAEQSIETFLNMLSADAPDQTATSSVLMNNDDAVLKVLVEPYTDRQVPLDHVQRNPFVIDEYSQSAKQVVQVGADDGVRQRRRRTEQFEGGAETLRLTSTLLGSTPLANINGEIYRVGDVLFVEQFDVSFKITKISTNSAVLVGTDPVLEITHEVRLTIDIDS